MALLYVDLEVYNTDEAYRALGDQTPHMRGLLKHLVDVGATSLGKAVDSRLAVTDAVESRAIMTKFSPDVVHAMLALASKRAMVCGLRGK